MALLFFGIGIKTDLFQSCGHCWVFQICWHIECSTFTASSFRIWKSSAGIPSPPLTLFMVFLPKAHLTSHSRMSGSRWVTTPSFCHQELFLCTLRIFLYLSLDNLNSVLLNVTFRISLIPIAASQVRILWLI